MSTPELNRLRATGLTQRLNDYSSNVDEIDSSIGTKKLSLAEQLRDVNKPKENKMSDALIQAVISLTPALMGYAAAGKEGAYYGLQGGAQGSELYGNILDKRHEGEQADSKLKAAQTQDELENLVKRRDKIDDRSASLQDKYILADLRESRSDARTDRLVGAGGFFGHKEGDVADTSVEGSTDATSNTENIDISGLTTDEQMMLILNESDRGRAIIEQDPKGAAKLADIMNKLKEGQGKDVVRAQGELALEGDNIEKSSREALNDFGFVKAVPTEATSKQQLEESKKLVNHYKSLHTSLKKMSDIIDDSNGLQRAGFSEGIQADLQAARQTAASAYTGLMQSRETDPGKSVFSFQQAEKWVPNVGSKWDETVSGFGQVMPLVNTLQSELKSKIKAVEGMLKDDLTTRGFEVVDDSLTGQSEARMPAYTDPVTGKVYDANYQEIN